MACGLGRDDCAGGGVFGGFASLWSSAFSAIALENEIIVYVPGQKGDDEPSSLGFSTRTSRLRKVGFQVSSHTRDEMKS